MIESGEFLRHLPVNEGPTLGCDRAFLSSGTKEGEFSDKVDILFVYQMYERRG